MRVAQEQEQIPDIMHQSAIDRARRRLKCLGSYGYLFSEMLIPDTARILDAQNISSDRNTNAGGIRH